MPCQTPIFCPGIVSAWGHQRRRADKKRSLALLSQFRSSPRNFLSQNSAVANFVQLLLPTLLSIYFGTPHTRDFFHKHKNPSSPPIYQHDPELPREELHDQGSSHSRFSPCSQVPTKPPWYLRSRTSEPLSSFQVCQSLSAIFESNGFGTCLPCSSHLCVHGRPGDQTAQSPKDITLFLSS